MIEVRGIGVVKLPRGRLPGAAPLALLVDLMRADAVERMPEPAYEWYRMSSCRGWSSRPSRFQLLQSCVLPFPRIADA